MTVLNKLHISDTKWFWLLCLVWVLLLTHQTIFHTFAPRSVWFEYHGVTFEGRTGDTGLLFKSHRTVFRITDFVFEDTLYCDHKDGHGFTNFGTMHGSLSDVPPDGPDVKTGRPWEWNIGRLPLPGTLCKLRYAPAVRLPGSITKEQMGWSDVFHVPEEWRDPFQRSSIRN